MNHPTCTRRLEFDAAHRITRHGSKCRNLHGHRYVVELTARATELDGLGMVIDFGVLKAVVGAWIDEALDHGAILNQADDDLIALTRANGWKLYVVPFEPTAENLAHLIRDEAARLLADADYLVEVVHVRVYETPNCWADA